MKFEARIEEIFKQLKLVRFSVERGHRCRKRISQFGNSVDIVMGICRIVVVCQVLKRQQNLVCLDYRRVDLTAESQLTARAVLFLTS